MSADTIEAGGERYVRLEVVAELYEVQAVVLRRCYERGVLGDGVVQGTSVCIATVQLDRVATICRLHGVHGLDVDAIVAWLER